MTRDKKIAKGIAAFTLMTVPALFATGCGSGATGKYIPGTYTGEGHGTGEIKANLTVDDNSITKVVLEGNGETTGVGGKEAIQDGTFAAQIMEAQSADIDGVSGATLTTEGVKQAVGDALSQATRETR
ncbi:MAG: FMN-binding protein [Coriobacteriia bacterium]